jgi:hypothetical protein
VDSVVLLGAPIDWKHAEKCRFQTSGMWHYVFGQIVPIVVKDHSAFILRVKQSAYMLQLLHPEGEGTACPSKLWKYRSRDTVSHPRRHESSAIPLWELQTQCARKYIIPIHISSEIQILLKSDIILFEEQTIL